MTGTIIELAAEDRTGVIRTPQGARVSFSASAVLGEFDGLAVGQRVNFDLDHGWPQRNVIRVLREPPPAVSTKPDAPADLRYRGFDQSQNVRSYRFDAVAGGHAVREFVVTVDVALLLKHHIGVQDAPALCMRKLASDLKNSPEALQHELGDDDLSAYALSRAALAERKRARPGPGRRGSPPPGPWRRPPEGG